MEIEAEALDYSVDVKLEPENAILNCGETFKASVLLKKGGQPISGQKMVVTTKWESKTVKEETIINTAATSLAGVMFALSYRTKTAKPFPIRARGTAS